MRVHRRFGAGRSPGLNNAQEVFGGGNRRHRPYLSHLVTAGRRPAGRPKCEEPHPPATSAASAVELATACAEASLGKVSMRQNNGPGGSCETFFSARGLMSNFCAWAADESSSPTITVTHMRREHRKAGA